MKSIPKYIFIIMVLIIITIVVKFRLESPFYIEDKLRNNIEIKEAILGTNNNKYQLKLTIKNNSAREYLFYNNDLEFYDDEFGKNEVYSIEESYESPVPAGLEATISLNIIEIETEDTSNLYLRLDGFDNKSNIIKLRLGE